MTQSNIFIDGVYTALATPFTTFDEIDYDSLEKSLQLQYKSDIKGLVLLGTTGESPTLANKEKISLVSFVYHYNEAQPKEKKILLIVGIGGNYTHQVIEFAKSIVKYADAFMVTVPYYNKPPQKGIQLHFEEISKSFSNIPIIMYNIPGRTCLDMHINTIINIINNCPNIVALKEANSDFDRLQSLVDVINNQCVKKVGNEFKIFSGDDVNVIQFCNLGCSGVISVASNIIPIEICTLTYHAINKLDEANCILKKNEDFLKFLFCETNPIPIKNIMYQCGIHETDKMRLPLITLDDDKGKRLMEKYKKN